MRHVGKATAGIVAALGMLVPHVGAMAAADGWTAPRCGVVEGDGSVSFTRNDGRTIAPTSVRQQPVHYVFGITATGTNRLLALDQRGKLRSSVDAGCSWSELGSVRGLDVPRLTASSDGAVYVWDQNSPTLFRVRGEKVTALPPVAESAGTGVVALAVDRSAPEHVRAVLGDGTVRDSYDAGTTFHTTAVPPVANLWVYSAGIDQSNLDHIAVGTMSEGIYSTWNGGSEWTRATLGKPHERVNAFAVTVSPADPRVVWAQGINEAEHDVELPSEGRHIYRSVDGGRTFDVAVDHDPGEVTLANGALLAPHPTDADVLYFVFGTSFANCGTDLFRFDASRDALSVRHNEHHGIMSIEFNPRDPAVMYLGFAAE